MAIRPWEEVENPQAPTCRLSGKQPLTKPEVAVRIVPPREVPATADDGEYEPDLRFLQGECHGRAGGEDTRFSSATHALL